MKTETVDLTCGDGSVCEVTLSHGRTQATYYYEPEQFQEMADNEWPVDGQQFELDGKTYECGNWDLCDGEATATVRLVNSVTK